MLSAGRRSRSTHPRRAAAVIACPATAGPPRGRGPGDITAAAFCCAPRTRRSAWRNTARGASWWGLSSRCHGVTGHVPERESNPRQSVYETDALTKLSYPVAKRTGIEPATCGIRRRSPSELSLPSRNILSRLRAYATAAPRAPVGYANPSRWKPFERRFVLMPNRHQSLRRRRPARRPCPASEHSASCRTQRRRLTSGNPFQRTVHARDAWDADRVGRSIGNNSIRERA